MPQALILSRNLVQQLFHHAQTEPDNEICGLIAASANRQLRACPITNVHTQPAQRFAMDEAQLAAAMRGLRERGETLFAIYHSHPTGPAIPSARDLADTTYPQAWRFIISLNTRGVLELRAWQLVDQQAVEAALRIIED